MRLLPALVLALLSAAGLRAVDAPAPTLHPALFLVGDSITKTGVPPGDTGPWGMGYELAPLFDPAKIHVYNEGAGGRSSRGYRDEDLWGKILERLQPGDFVLVMFGHNDTANSANYPDRATITGNGGETVQTGVGDKRQVLHTYGWYLREYIKDVKAKGATVLIGSPFPRNTWSEGKIKRGFDGYAQWAADAAQAGGAFFLETNRLACDRYDALGQAGAAAYFNDPQHTTKAGARMNAGAVAEGLRQLPDCPLKDFLLPVATVWRLDSTAQAGGHATEVLGTPAVVPDAAGPAVQFNGTSDGLLVPVNPLQGCAAFTIEACFRPDTGGPAEQRFLHLEETAVTPAEPGSRALLEIRLADGTWALDAFLFAQPTKARLVLLDPAKRHPADRWTWVAMVYDHGRLTSYIDGVKELEGEVAFPPMGPGRVSLGVRQNKVSWFKGGLREVRWHDRALAPEQLQRMK